MSGELTPLDVLIDLLGGADFDHEILDPEASAKIILRRLADGNGGYRICGPKYVGNSRTVKKHKLTPRDVEEIRRYLSVVGTPAP